MICSFRDQFTDAAVTLPGFHFSLFDLDGGGDASSTERVRVTSFTSYTLEAGTHLDVVPNAVVINRREIARTAHCLRPPH